LKINEIKLQLLQCNKTNSKTSASIQAAVSKYTEKCVAAIATTSTYVATTAMDVGDVAEEGVVAIATTSNNTEMDIGDVEEEGAVATTSAESMRYSFKNLC
jgi:hypothetical protein